ncbi:T9SS type A sorting domain-containing protein [Chryseobacterium sp. C-71]|uniref:T9SS type A sorting domain-containing protein n=1 Tax=Chryseobacterium sp. C-71 TaxID=2893882 RepID=UPI001E3D645A|nr:T9SS type A sorting domain-containing protein [Chryseobacterium sp. C-71]UFH31982.1 T9SS type A sorting domain-containing protein [Chryseobacterium sp. C-71]
MRKLQLFFLMMVFCVSVNFSAQNTCVDAIPITSLPFSSGAQTTCGTGNDYAAGTFTSDYGGGEDYVYSIEITNAPITLGFALGGAATWKVASVHSACAPTLANSIGSVKTSSGTTASGGITFPTNGTYYIIVDTWPTPNCGAFTLNITPPPACATLTAPSNGSTVNTLSPSLTWTAPTTGVAPTGYKVYFGTTNPPTTLASTVTAPTTSYTATLTNYNTPYYWYVVPVSGAAEATGCNSNVWSFTSPPPPPPPANDDCVNAVTLTVNPDYLCGVKTSGTTVGGTPSAEIAATCAATGTNDDVWFKFTATNTAHRIVISNVSGSTDMAMAIYSGNCGSLVSVQCSDPNTMNVTGLTVGQEYKVRVWTYTATATTNATFDICVGTLPPPPVNDDCAGAIALTVNPDLLCGAVTSGNTQSATASTETAPTCAATGTNDDVWFKFTATSVAHRVILSNVSGTTDMAMAAYSGACGSLVQVLCSDPNTMDLTGLTVGQEYKVRVWTLTSTATTVASFDICVGTLPPPPANDNCANAVVLTSSANAICVATVSGTTFNATASVDALAPCTGVADDDVWYSFVATSTAHTVTLSNVVSVGTTSSTALNLQVLSGACGALTSVLCDTTSASPAALTGLTVGNTYFVRVYNNATGSLANANTFNICVTTTPPPPINDDCAGAIIVTPNTTPVAGTTVSATQSTGTAPTCSATSINDDVWYSFTATSATHLVTVLYSDNATATQVYSGSCGSLVAVACFSGAYGNSNILLPALTVGNTYYVRIYSTSATVGVTSNFTIAVSTPVVPTNDTCATATAIACGGTITGNNALAADETLPTSTCGATTTTANYKGVWYTVTAVANGPITIDACGSKFDSYLRVYTGSCASLTCFANTDGVGYADSGCTVTLYNAPKLTFNGVAGTTYYVLFSSYDAAQMGDYSLAITQDCTVLGTADIVKNDKVKAFPNPFADVLNISDVKNVKSISIVDIAGRVVKTIDKPSTSLQLRELNSGMYMVILNMNDGSRQTIKAIKK